MKRNRVIYKKYMKRFLDIVCSCGALIVLSPILLIIAVLVKIKLGTPVLFKQERVGLNGSVFKLYKFRTMTDEKDMNGNILPDEKRLTTFGRRLRATSLDELPELVNIIKGNMSIIGPRPLLPSYIPYYTNEESHRHDVRPGLTGLAQINGRSFISWEEVFKLDLDYVKNIKFSRDIKIIIYTIKMVLAKDNISDATEMIREGNNLYILVDGKKQKVHEALDKERKSQ
ncbi:MAG: sugar transferase [Firmicutes bacterium]|nr:sugar transferase [Bacillota bacterium]